MDFRLSPDETRLAASIVDPTSVPHIWMTDLVRGGTVRFTFGPKLNSGPVWSPGGERLAFRSNRKGLTELYQKSAGAGGSDQPLLTEDVARLSSIGSANMIPTRYEPRWRADGNEIYYLSRDGTLMAVPVSPGAARFGVPKPLFQTRVPTGVSMLRTHYVPSRDGNRFLVSVRTGEPMPVPITVVLNWTAGLKK